GGVKDHCVCPGGRVPAAAGVEQKRCSAGCGVGTPIVQGQCSTAKTGVKAARGIEKERIPANSCVSSAAGQVKKRLAPFRCREPGIAPVRCRTWEGVRSCLHLWQKRQAQQGA